MLQLNFNEVAALQMILQFINLKDLLKAANDGFALQESENSLEKSDLIFKASEAFLR